MQIVTNTQERLVIRARSWLIPGLVALTAAGGAAAALLEPDMSTGTRAGVLACAIAMLLAAHIWLPLATTIVFDRASRSLTIARRRITGTRHQAIALDEVSSAQVQAEWTDDARLQRIGVTVGGRYVPLEIGFGSGDRRQIEDAINDWLTRP